MLVHKATSIFEPTRHCQLAHLYFVLGLSWTVSFQRQPYALYTLGCSLTPRATPSAIIIPSRQPWPKQRPLLRLPSRCHRYHCLGEGMTLVLEVPRSAMMRNEQSQTQEPALEGTVIGYDTITVSGRTFLTTAAQILFISTPFAGWSIICMSSSNLVRQLSISHRKSNPEHSTCWLNEVEDPISSIREVQ